MNVYCILDFDVNSYVLDSLKHTGRWMENNQGEFKIECSVELITGMLWWKKTTIKVLWVHEDDIRFVKCIHWGEIQECSNMK